MKRKLFHTVLAQGLFLCKRARPDIAPAIAFLTTRVQHPTRKDWMKLVNFMRYLKGSAEDLLTLGADGSGTIKWYTDASFAVHPDFRSHIWCGHDNGKQSDKVNQQEASDEYAEFHQSRSGGSR
jgi:hypothetical protein